MGLEILHLYFCRPLKATYFRTLFFWLYNHESIGDKFVEKWGVFEKKFTSGVCAPQFC